MKLSSDGTSVIDHKYQPEVQIAWVSQVTDARGHVDNQFKGLFRDIFNIIEISYSSNPDIGKKVKELVGKRISLLNEDAMRVFDSLYPVGYDQSLPPVAERLQK